MSKEYINFSLHLSEEENNKIVPVYIETHTYTPVRDKARSTGAAHTTACEFYPFFSAGNR